MSSFCRLKQSKRFAFWHDLGIVRAYRNSESHLVECAECGHCRFDEAPKNADLSHFYESEMGRAYERDYSEANREAVKVLFTRIFNITGTRKPYVHDDGCGSGYIVHYLNAQGVRASGTDCSQAAIAYGQSQGVKNIAAMTAQVYITSHGRKPDIIFLQHVLEHFHNPVAYLRSLHSLLRPGGHLAIFVPNRQYAPVQHEGFKKDPAFLYPMHLNYFTPHSLQCSLTRAGFKTIHIEATPNFGFSQTMRAELLEALASIRPDWSNFSEDEKIAQASKEFLTYELLCIAKADPLSQIFYPLNDKFKTALRKLRPQKKKKS